MNTPLQRAVLALAVTTLVFASGCRIERTRGQRRQVQAIDTILRVEAGRIAAQPASAATSADYARLVSLYTDLTAAAIASGSAVPDQVQFAEDELLVIIGEARSLEAYRAWDPESQRNLDKRFWSSRLTKWRQWRGPGYDMAGAHPD